MSYHTPSRVPELGFYYHYKHDDTRAFNEYAYEVIGVGFHTEEVPADEEHFVVYRPLYEASVYKTSVELGVPCFDVRPLGMWMGEVEKDGVRFPRFQKITDPEIITKLEQLRVAMY